MHSILLILFVILSAAGAAHSQTAADAPPVWKVGDTWEYSNSDLLTGLEQSKTRLEITESDADGYTIRSFPSNIITRSSRSMNFAFKDEKRSSESGHYQFPMEVGKSWKTVHFYSCGSGVCKDEFTREIVAKEKVKVPAGEFEAYKIVAKGWFYIVENRDGRTETSGRKELTYWYSPEVRRQVKYEWKVLLRWNPPSGRDELLSYSLQ